MKRKDAIDDVMSPGSMRAIFDQIKDKQILIVGDVMIDAYLWGMIDRISPEAPVPIVNIERKENRPGGAANVALNISSLGAKPILCSIVGDDEWARMFKSLMKDSDLSTDYILEAAGRPTTKKTRVISNNKHILRFDAEVTDFISREMEDRLLEVIADICKTHTIGAAILQDYNKGLLTERMIHSIVKICQDHHIPVAVDPKKVNFMAYKGVDLFKPNLKELKEGLKKEIDPNSIATLDEAAKKLQSKLHFEKLLVTLSDKGVYFLDEHGDSQIIPAHARKIVDVSGAGDTVISVAAAAMAAGAEMRQIAYLSNLAGGLVCEKVGVVPIEKQALLAELQL